ncbi:unnamed protein product [Lota lota]
MCGAERRFLLKRELVVRSNVYRATDGRIKGDCDGRQASQNLNPTGTNTHATMAGPTLEHCGNQRAGSPGEDLDSPEPTMHRRRGEQNEKKEKIGQ